MPDPVVHITNGIPDSGTGNITTLGQTLVDGANATMGVTTGAAVTTDASGTLQQYLRGIVKLIAAKVGVTIADGDSATFGAKADAANAATDTTAISAMSVFKQISKTLQAAAMLLSGGATPTSGVAAASNNATNIKASAGVVYGVQLGNISQTTPYFLKLYDKATAPNPVSDTPVATLLIPPNWGGNNGIFPVGKKFSTGIGFAIVAGIAVNDNTAVPAATITFNIDWN